MGRSIHIYIIYIQYNYVCKIKRLVIDTRRSYLHYCINALKYSFYFILLFVDLTKSTYKVWL